MKERLQVKKKLKMKIHFERFIAILDTAENLKIN